MVSAQSAMNNVENFSRIAADGRMRRSDDRATAGLGAFPSNQGVDRSNTGIEVSRRPPIS